MERESLSSAIGSFKPQSTLEKVAELYDRNLFLQAYKASQDCWSGSTDLSGYSLDELILGSRLAARLGGPRLARWLGRAAIKCDPSHPKVRYYTLHLQMGGRRHFAHFRSLNSDPELEAADDDTQASWLASAAVQWASIRDFGNAHRCLDAARRCAPEASWVFSCESDVLAYQDRWDEALVAAERAWELNPGAPYAARSLGSSLLNLRRVEQAAERLARAGEQGESYEVAHTACWYLGALAETSMGDERACVIGRAKELGERMFVLAPLADRETRSAMARTMLDIAELADDHAGIEQWAEKARSPFHRKMLENMRRNPGGQRIRLPFHHTIQRHNECLPTSLGSAMMAMGTPIDADAMAAELTFGGTPEWAAAEWLEKRGFVVRFFVATPEVTAALINNGFAFELTLEWDTSAHAVAVVGLDEAAGTVMVHDPGSFRSTDYLLEYLGNRQAPLGPRAMIAVKPERAALLDQLLDKSEVDTMTAREAWRRAEYLQGHAASREVARSLAESYPSHPNTRLLQALQDHEDGRVGAALQQFQTLLEQFPGSAFVRSNLLACCRSLRNTALMRKTLGDVVERGILPGVEAQQQWMYPPADYVSEYADLLRLSGATSGKAKKLLHSLLARAGFCASAWHILGDLLWTERDLDGALLGFRIASGLADRNEHYARAYSDTLAQVGRPEEGFAWLGERVLRFGNTLDGWGTWMPLISALEDAGYPGRALAVVEDALQAQSGSAELLAFLAPFHARMGNWSEAEELLRRLEKAGNNVLYHRALSRFHSMRGEFDQALEHADKWLDLSPLSMEAHEEVVTLIARLNGAAAAVERARRWLKKRPEDENFQELYCEQLNRDSYTSWHKYSVLLRRVNHNREDGWAWRELAFCAMYDYEMADGKRQKRLGSRIQRYLAECERTSPGDTATLRAIAHWQESRSQWTQAVNSWIEAIERDPASLYSYRHAWDCAARLGAEERLAVWSKIQNALLRETGHSSVAREMSALAAQRFGVSIAEEAVARWMKARPEDPEVIESYVDLLLNYGHGRTDYERALELLLPELARFPYKLGLRLSHASTLQRLGRLPEAEEAFREILRRHPDNSWSRIRLAWIRKRRGESNAAFEELEQAAARDPQNSTIWTTRAEILIEEQRYGEAREVVHAMCERFRSDVSCREEAIRLQLECGDLEGAIATARQGVVEHPRGAYLWLLLGRTLAEHKEFAAPGEVESCLRRSLALNRGMYEAADYLAMLLVEQRRYAEAEQILNNVAECLPDPAPAQGRLAWIRRRRGERKEALEDVTNLITRAPWYAWGWGVLLDWLSEDKRWEEARRILGEPVPEQWTNTRWRQHRLELLAKAGEKAEVLDAQWNNLLGDFPEAVPPHLIRYDALHEAKRWPEATAILEHIRSVDPDSPYVIARWIEVIAREGKKEEAIVQLMRLFFAETEPSNWPPDYAWEAIKTAKWEDDAYAKALELLREGRLPTGRTAFILANYVVERFKIEKKSEHGFLRSVWPERGAREILNLLRMIDAGAESGNSPRAKFLAKLSDFGYERLVVKAWRKSPEKVEADIASWAETARALTGRKQYRTSRKFLAGWRERKGVAMWMMTNYLICLTGTDSASLKEVRSSCRDALDGLPHDHCARYLAHRQAEACALLQDEAGFRQCMTQYREYFEGRIEKEEWFEQKRRYLFADLPALARCLEQNDLQKYRAGVRQLRWERIKLTFSSWRLRSRVRPQWWWIIWAIWLLGMLSRIFSDHQ
jgi:predicted Zn-dependent protease